MKNILKEKIATQQAFFGTSAILGALSASNILASSGYDYIMVDLQHGHFDKLSATAAVQAMARTEAVPFIRVADNNPGLINDALDAGALGVVVPMINSAKEAEKAVEAAFYPPWGQRSKGPAAAAFWGDGYAKQANEQIMLTVMIETPQAVEKAMEILAVQHIDLCLVGTSDLSFTVGCERDSPIMTEYLQQVIAAGKKYNIPIGAAVGTPEQVKPWQDLGVQFFLAPHDMSMLINVAKKSAFAYRQALK